MRDPICATQNPAVFGYRAETTGNNFEITFDIAAAISVLSVRVCMNLYIFVCVWLYIYVCILKVYMGVSLYI